MVFEICGPREDLNLDLVMDLLPVHGSSSMSTSLSSLSDSSAEPFEIVIGSEKRTNLSRTLCFYYVIIEKYLN